MKTLTMMLAFAGAFVLSNPSLAAGDAEAGAAVFKRCASCHAVGEGAKNKVGPELNEVFGRVAGSLPDYKYSNAMVEAGAGGLTWTPETLAEFLHGPKDFVKGTKMSFAGLKTDEDIANIEAYLLTFSPNFVPAEGEAAPAAQ